MNDNDTLQKLARELEILRERYERLKDPGDLREINLMRMEYAKLDVQINGSKGKSNE